MAKDGQLSELGHEASRDQATPDSPVSSGFEAVDGRPPAADVARGPASQPTPTGDPAHPGVVEKDGFYFFRDEYQLPAEPSVEDAETLYLGEVEKAFQNRWELHPNLIVERTDAQKVKHAYDLDFRENEIKRIREVLPVDGPVFNYIDALVDVVMLKNLEIYVDKRLSAFRHIVRNTRVWFSAFFGIMLASALAVGGVLKLPATALWEFGPIFAIAMATAFTLLAVTYLTWPNLIDLALKGTKEKYEEAVRDAAGLASSKLATKGRDVADLMHSLKNKLDTISSPDASRVEQASKLVRILLWNPERMGLIENYYRAKMDQFMVNSARVSIDSAVNTNGIIYNRYIFLSVLSVFFFLGLGAAWLMGFGTAAAGAAGPVNLPGMWMMLAALLLVFAAVAAVVLCAFRLARLSRTFEPADVSRHNTALLSNGLRAAILAVALGVAPAAVISVVQRQSFVPTTAVSFALLMLAIVWFTIPVIYAHRIFRKYEHHYSSNVLAAVRKKMEASLWTRYSDLRIDQRIAEVFNAIYAAWYKADSKGVYGPHP